MTNNPMTSPRVERLAGRKFCDVSGAVPRFSKFSKLKLGSTMATAGSVGEAGGDGWVGATEGAAFGAARKDFEHVRHWIFWSSEDFAMRSKSPHCGHRTLIASAMASPARCSRRPCLNHKRSGGASKGNLRPWRGV